MKTVILAGLALLPLAALAEEVAAIGPGAVQLTGSSAVRFESGSTRVKSSEVGIDVGSDFTELGLHAAGFYFVARNVGLGVSAAYDRSSEKSEGIEEVSTTLTIGPTISALLPVAERVALFARGTVGYAIARTTTTGEPDMKANGYGFSLQGGVGYFVAPQVSLDAALAYTYTKLTTEKIQTSSGTIPEMVGTGSGITVAAGLSVYFGR